MNVSEKKFGEVLKELEKRAAAGKVRAAKGGNAEEVADATKEWRSCSTQVDVMRRIERKLSK